MTRIDVVRYMGHTLVERYNDYNVFLQNYFENTYLKGDYCYKSSEVYYRVDTAMLLSSFTPAILVVSLQFCSVLFVAPSVYV